ncbi:MAG: hypothetical protein ABJK37_13065 [Paraglaciecola sp.]|uniref:hypothetical protein n=1 Tax=Paraglaciecola sp. TaxID=1920173 RepID=UPI003299E97C
MRHSLLVSVLVWCLFGCSASSLPAADPSERHDSKQAFGEKCEDAKYQLDKAVEEGQTSDLRELKNNIELHCVWRRN